MAALQPARLVCPTCGLEDYVSWKTIGPALWRFECANPHCLRPGGAAMTWQSTTTSRVDESASTGKAEELGLYQDLLLCLVPGEPYVEYGVVEHRYVALRPDVFAQLVEHYGHRRVSQGHDYTASSFIAGTLGRLADRGDILQSAGKATGYWSYNGEISFWARPPGPADPNDHLSYRVFAEREGLDPTA